MVTIEELKCRRESEDRTEFKEAKSGFNFDGGSHNDQAKRRKCLLGYVVAMANEGGGTLVFGMGDTHPHPVVGTQFLAGRTNKAIDDIYQRLGIRVVITELFEGPFRVVVVEVPRRPIGRYLEFEGVGLVRLGDSLRNMDQTQIFQILSEQEPDFSAKVCPSIGLDDLDADAIKEMRFRYSQKNRHSNIASSDIPQTLSDLGLMTPQKQLTYAALLLLGKQGALSKELPQASIIWEFRQTQEQTHFDDRKIIKGPIFLSIDSIWELIDSKNTSLPVRDKAYITSIKVYNEEVIREAVLNAVAHRDYTYQSEVVIKQYPQSIEIHNPGGFPKGVSLDNLVTVSSTPRSRLMTEILEKTGLVERSGQGIDKIFFLTLQEGKPEPDYSHSTMFQVSLILTGKIEDPAFSNFIQQIQHNEIPGKKLSALDIINLNWIKKGLYAKISSNIIARLEEQRLIVRTTNSQRYALAEGYYQMTAKEQRIGTRYFYHELYHLLFSLEGKKNASIGELEKLLAESLNRNQIKYLLSKLIEDQVVATKGAGRGTKYYIDPLSSGSELSTAEEIIKMLQLKYSDEAIALPNFTPNSGYL